MSTRLYDEFIRRLIEVNDENKTDMEHRLLQVELYAWKEGAYDATGYYFNGDYYYFDLIDKGLMEERPMCAGVFLDWESKV